MATTSWVSLLFVSILCPQYSSCESMSSAGLGQEFNATLGVSISLLLQDPTDSYRLQFDSGDSAPPFYVLEIVTGQNLPVSGDDMEFQTKGVWRANAEPVKNNCTLRLDEDGNLVLRDYDGTVYWQTNTSDAGVVSMALLPTGNLVLLDTRNSTVWQSFDHPSDTLVLGQRLTTAGASMLQQGPYSLGIYDTGLYLFYSNGGAQRLPYWQLYPAHTYTSASTTSAGGGGAVAVAPAAAAAQLGVAEVTRDEFQLFALANSSALVGSIPLPPFDNNASLNDYSWWLLQLGKNAILEGFRANSSQHQASFSLPSTMQPCAIPDSCTGPFYAVCAQDTGNCSSCPLVLSPDQDSTNLDPSCAASVLPYPSCSTPEDIAAHRLLNLTGFTYFALAFNVSTVSSTLEDCADICLRNCSCKAAFYVTSTSACLHVSVVSNLINASGKTDHLAFIKYQQQLESPVPSPHTGSPVPSPHIFGRAPLPGGDEPGTSAGHPAIAEIVRAALGTTAAVLIIMIVSCSWHFWRRKSRNTSDDDVDEEVFLGTLPGLPPRFSFKELKACTNNFSCKLGAGGFGTVYEGVNPRDTLKPVAVKQLEIGVRTRGSRQFQAEIATIGSIQHVNLVRLHGFCMEGSHRLLVYELMSNGSLDAYIKKPRAAGSDHAHHGPLSWRTRFGIALGTARGLAYLHDQCRERIIHCDIKPENILLNHRLEPAISDFGLAKLMSREQSYVATTMRGTRGYLAPEWVRNAPITEKSDVYSYGMVLLELVSGRRLFDAEAAISERRYLPEWALSLDGNHDRGRAEMIDERLMQVGDQEKEEVEEAACQMIAIALLCIHEDPNARPSMAMVVKMLEGDAQLPPLLPPNSINVLSYNSESPTTSSNPLTMSSVYPR